MEKQAPFGRGGGLVPFPPNSGMDRSGVLVGLSSSALSGLRSRAVNENDEGVEEDDDVTRLEQHRILERLRQLKLWQDRQQMLLAEQQKLILLRLEEERRNEAGGQQQQQQYRQQQQQFDEDDPHFSHSDDDSATESVESGISPLEEMAGFHPELTDITEEASMVQDCTSFTSEVAGGERGGEGDVGEHGSGGGAAYKGDEVSGRDKKIDTQLLDESDEEEKSNSVGDETAPPALSAACLDDLPISTKVGHGVRSFEELVEMQLRQEQPIGGVNANSNSILPSKKRPFLKRGT